MKLYLIFCDDEFLWFKYSKRIKTFWFLYAGKSHCFSEEESKDTSLIAYNKCQAFYHVNLIWSSHFPLCVWSITAFSLQEETGRFWVFFFFNPPFYLIVFVPTLRPMFLLLTSTPPSELSSTLTNKTYILSLIYKW